MGGLYAKDLETERIPKSIACDTPARRATRLLGVRPVSEPIGILIDGYDRWWKSDPNGPAELAEVVRTHGPPWFEKVQSLEDQATHWYFRTAIAHPWRKPDLTALAATLHRLGELDEALALFEPPVPKTAIAPVAEGRCVQRWLEDRSSEA